LSRHAEFENKGHAYVGISAERKNLSPKENAARMNEMEAKIKKHGFGYRKTTGMWEGGSENSFVVYAKKPGKKHSDDLHNKMKELSTHYDQDAFLHHDGKSAMLHGTNDTGDLGRGNSMSVGVNHYNVRNDYGMTKFGRGKHANSKPSLTATSKMRQPVRKPNLP